MRLSDSNSIQRQLQISVTLAVAVLFAAGAISVYLFVRSDANEQFLAKMEALLRDYVEETEMDFEGKVDASFHDMALARFEAEPIEDQDEIEEEGVLLYVFRNYRGEVVVKSPWLKDASHLPFDPQSDDHIAFSSVTLADGLKLRTASTSFQLLLEVLDPEEIGVIDDSPVKDYDAEAPENRYHLVIAESDSEIRHMLIVLAIALGVTGLVITVSTALLIFKLVSRACRPIEFISELTASIDTEHLDARLPEDRAPEELKPLVRQFNALLGRVESAFARERRFSADIAHELRTPVTELRSLAEVALVPSHAGDEITEDPAEVYREAAAIGERMGRLIEVLSELHRAENESVKMGTKPVSVPELLEQAIAAVSPLADSRKRSIEVQNDLPSDSNLRITTDPAMFRGILDNLLGNAVTHSKPGRPIICKVGGNSANGSLLLEIRNTADGLTSDDLVHLHEPFWQKDAARSESSHFGLGLSTVAAYAKLLGIRVDYRLDDGDFIATLKIPGAD